MFLRCDLESVARDIGVLRECDSMRCSRRSIKSKNRDTKREGDADTDTEKERERAVATCLEFVAVIMEFEECH